MASSKANLARSYLKIGAEVEATSVDPGLRGTLFPATIIAGPSESNKFVVEYKNLLENDESLREEIDMALLRPFPPPEHDYSFDFGDEVGEGPTYWVYFRFAQQQFSFQAEELRHHREWVEGYWLPPREWSIKKDANSSKARMKKFKKGTPVEVSSDEDGFQGAWFAATVLDAIGQEKYLIEYRSLRTEDGTNFLREEVDIQHIRPRPPESVMACDFNLNEEVDAFYNDGWWEGVISRFSRAQGTKFTSRARKTKRSFSTLP
ncbi:protein AGENET DOMAIN (AGD)-CONTAINING P1-like isoform X2 [Juglans microcarpa x Juglans regia]|uniref:protein AGENET DOMAIN (AGD)-CONTAINING P1-like isoform X2 n=1 Tax=Juglans microcarpa x Juglans regia TaxID=2249226 RepID=UPI001B7DF2BF|nr:protein AGENET DOMAIN (AGD)-CONTAINING P1-like isoform X2 [Juglans microcarpa x Juglans regia]